MNNQDDERNGEAMKVIGAFWIIAVFIFLVIMAIGKCRGDDLIPSHEWKIINEVAREYRLDEDGRYLLAAIRRHENGLAGLEFGIGGAMDSGHPAHRFALTQADRTLFNEQSFRCQARWAAGTIKRRYHGDLLVFARRYCPNRAWNWYTGVSSLIFRLKQEHKKER